jgi:hypothetical protein
MGWWGIGGDDIMGDHPADVIGEALLEMAALAAKKGLYNVTLGELTATFTSVVERAPKLIEDLPRRPEVAGEQLNAAIREQLERSGFVPVERSELRSDVLFSVLWRALQDISQAYLDCEIERPPSPRI